MWNAADGSCMQARRAIYPVLVWPPRAFLCGDSEDESFCIRCSMGTAAVSRAAPSPLMENPSSLRPATPGERRKHASPHQEERRSEHSLSADDAPIFAPQPAPLEPEVSGVHTGRAGAANARNSTCREDPTTIASPLQKNATRVATAGPPVPRGPDHQPLHQLPGDNRPHGSRGRLRPRDEPRDREGALAARGTARACVLRSFWPGLTCD